MLCFVSSTFPPRYMQRYFLLLVLLLAGSPTFAQTELPIAQPNSPTSVLPPQPASDTLAAIHKLFAKRRRQQTFGALGIVVATAVSIATLNSSTQPSSGQGGGAYGITAPSPTNDGLGIDGLGIGIISIPVLAGELFYFDGYNRKHEQQAKNDFKAHRLSKALKRKLKPKFFR